MWKLRAVFTRRERSPRKDKHEKQQRKRRWGIKRGNVSRTTSALNKATITTAAKKKTNRRHDVAVPSQNVSSSAAPPMSEMTIVVSPSVSTDDDFDVSLKTDGLSLYDASEPGDNHHYNDEDDAVDDADTSDIARHKSSSSMLKIPACEIDGIDRVEQKNTFDVFLHFEELSSMLVTKSTRSDHKGKAGIRETINKLATIAFDHDRYDAARKIFRMAMTVQEGVVVEAIIFVAHAMRCKALKYRTKEEDYLGLLYHLLANKLADRPTQDNLQLSYNVHTGIRKERNGGSVPSSLGTIEKRMAHARDELFTLAQIVLMRDKCNSKEERQKQQ